MKRGKLACAALAAATVAIFAGSAQASVTEFAIYDGTKTSPVLIDAAYGGAHDDRDYRQVRRAVQDLRQDVAMVTGAIDGDHVRRLFLDDELAQAARLAGADQSKVPALLTQAREPASAIIVGEIGKSDLVDEIIAAGKFDEASQIKGKWEAHAVKQISNPLPGIDSALVIAGSDARGTIYGIYSLSERIGVSPWYWYSDVPIERRATITLDGAVHVDNGPDVKYRGIFINDEERTIDWAKLKFPTAQGTPDVNYYRHVYELMLRLKLNTIWPAMHEGTTSFNAATNTGMYDAGTPINAKEAAAYGVVASSSHAELMLRSNVEEWRPFYERNRVALNIQGSNYTAAFNYSINKPAIIQYWRERLLANREFESILALGMRGVHDGAPAFTANNPHGFANTVQMVGDAITEQRKLIQEVYGSIDAVPQVFVPYKEMADLYNAGLKAYIPGDVTLMWAEDNAGYLRQVPTRAEAARSGGNGIYYHSSYWGAPKSYLWLNSAPMALMVEQLQRAFSSDAGRFWILNVGDIKPGEMKTELFAKLAWDVDGYDDSNIKSRFLVEQLQRDFKFSAAEAVEVADALDRFSTLENTKRAEYWGTQNPSGVHSAAFNASYSFPLSATADGDELQRYLNEANALVAVLDDVSANLGERYRSAFYQQVLHRVRSYRNQAEQIGYYWKNQLAAEQRRYGSTTIYAELSKAARERIKADEAYFHALEDGKWTGAIAYSHPITYYGGVNEGIVMLTDDRYASVTSPSDGVGASAEGQKTAGAGTLRFNSASPEDERFFDVFNHNDIAEGWIAETDAPWLVLSATSGRTATEQRVGVTVSWSQLDASATGTIRVYNAIDDVKSGTPVATFTVRADKSAVDLAGTRGHAEANGYVAIEAEHFAENLPGADGTRWGVVKSNAQRGDTMKAYPETATRVDADFASTARLKYRVHFTSSGQFTGTFYRLPTLNEGTDDSGATRSTRTAIGLGETPPVSATVRGCAQTSCGSAWASNVMRQIEPLTFTINVPAPGWHDLVVYRSDAAIVFDRIVIPTTSGAVGDGLVGPPESPNSIVGAPAQTAKVAPLPKLVTASRALPAISLSVGQIRTVEGIEDAATVSSGNPTAASVELIGGRVQITARRAGNAAITVVGRDGALTSFTVTVLKGEGPALGAYQERDGLVVVDAVDALEKTTFANAIDSNNATHTWALTRNGLQTVPIAIGSAQNWLATSAAQGQALLAAAPTQRVNGGAAAGTPPRLEFTVDIANGGTYYLFVNTSNPNATADSYHVAVDRQWKYHSSKGGEELGTETWYGSTSVTGAALALQPGEHRVSIWTREAGLFVNQLALTKSIAPGLAGFQTTSARKRLTPLLTTHALSPAAPDGKNDWYTSSPTLTLTSEPGASTHYKLSSDAFEAYTAPITIQQAGTTAVTYRSTDALGNVEADKTITIKLDKTAPATSATISGAPDADGWHSYPATVTLTSTDSDSGVAGTQYAIDGGAWRLYDQPFSVPIGEHTIRYRSTDHAGLAETAKQTTVKSRVQTTHPSTIGGSVPGTLSLNLGAPASFDVFVPGSDREYTAATTANVVTTAGDAALTVGDAGHLTNGTFALSEPLRVELSKTTWTAPVSNDPVTITFRQHIGSTQPLRTGTYSRTVTFTLSTTTP